MNEKKMNSLVPRICITHGSMEGKQDKIFRHKRLSTGAKFVHVYLEIWDKGILELNKLLM